MYIRTIGIFKTSIKLITIHRILPTIQASQPLFFLKIISKLPPKLKSIPNIDKNRTKTTTSILSRFSLPRLYNYLFKNSDSSALSPDKLAMIAPTNSGGKKLIIYANSFIILLVSFIVPSS